MIGTTRDPSGSHMNAYFPDGCVEYTKRSTRPTSGATDGCGRSSKASTATRMVFVNDDSPAGEPYGYGEFLDPLDPFLRYGAPNTIKVERRAHDDSRLVLRGGHLPPRAPAGSAASGTHLAIDGACDHARRRSTTSGAVIVEIAAEVENETPTHGDRAGAQLDRRRRRRRSGSRRDSADAPPAHVTAIARQRLHIADPRSWSLDHPEPLHVHRPTTSTAAGIARRV